MHIGLASYKVLPAHNLRYFVQMPLGKCHIERFLVHSTKFFAVCRVECDTFIGAQHRIFAVCIVKCDGLCCYTAKVSGHVPKSTSKYFRGRHRRNKVDKVLKYVVGDTGSFSIKKLDMH